MKILSVVVSVTVFFTLTASAQTLRISEYDIHIGKAYPVSPQPFYDYWKTGTAVGGGIGFTWSPTISALILADYSWYAVDRDRYFTGIGLSSDGNSFSGGTTNIVSTMGLIRYFPREGVAIPIFLDCGLAFSYSSIGESATTFSGFTVNQASKDWLVALAVVGGGLAYPAKKFDLYVEGKYFIGIVRGTGAHSNYSLLTAGVRVPF
jgi:hypothetical protein